MYEQVSTAGWRACQRTSGRDESAKDKSIQEGKARGNAKRCGGVG